MYAIRSYYGFVLVASLPTRPVVIGIGAALIVAGILVAWRIGRARPTQIVAAALALGLGGVAWTVIVITSYSIHYTKLYET